MAFLSIHAEAKAKLSDDDIARLTNQLQEQLDISRGMIAEGVPSKKAARMGKRAAIQTIASFIEIERMFAKGTGKAT